MYESVKPAFVSRNSTLTREYKSKLFRNKQVDKNPWRNLTDKEIKLLIDNGNTASSWQTVLVTDPFDFSLIVRSSFYGLVRIGKVEQGFLKYHDFTFSQGIFDSLVIACDIGDNCAINKCHYISHYIISLFTHCN